MANRCAECGHLEKRHTPKCAAIRKGPGWFKICPCRSFKVQIITPTPLMKEVMQVLSEMDPIIKELEKNERV